MENALCLPGMSLPSRTGLVLACVLATGLGACAHGVSEGANSRGTGVTSPRPPQAPRFIHRRTFVERNLQAAVEECDPLCQRYKAATDATKYPQPAGISVALTALDPSTSGLVWQDGKILMGTWTELKYFKDYQPGQSFKLDGDTWWTAVPIMQQWCQSTGLQGDALRLRIAQRLGMPPNAPNDGFVAVWVDPQDIFRPCPDPESQDRECMVQVPMVPPYQPTDGQPPWACSGTQVNASFVKVHDSHLAWMCTNWKSSFLNSNPLDNYPWTALGYTYDWGSDNPVGPSEFVSLDGTEVVFQQMEASDAYCTPGQ
jgi:hypothetical protein